MAIDGGNHLVAVDSDLLTRWSLVSFFFSCKSICFSSIFFYWYHREKGIDVLSNIAKPEKNSTKYEPMDIKDEVEFSYSSIYETKSLEFLMILDCNL